MNESKPLISIITPAYNAEKHLPATIESILNQTYKNWELLITDDASLDNTRAVVQSYQKNDRRIQYIKHETNSGPAMARQSSIDRRSGQILAFIDSDDLWLPKKLEKQLVFMKKEKSCFSYTGFCRISDDGGVLGSQIVIPESLSYHKLLKNTAIATSTVIIDLNKIKTITMTPGFLYDDFLLWLDILREGVVARGLNLDLMRYRVLSGSVSRNKFKSSLAVWRIYREKLKLPVHQASFNLLCYALNAFRKYRKF